MSASLPSRRPARFAFCLLAFGLTAFLAGCHSRFVDATLTNQGPAPVRLVEVEYPSASFGVQSLEPAVPFHYRFKIQGSGTVRITYTDAGGQTHSSNGPELDEGQEGPLSAVVGSDGRVRWSWQPVTR